MMPRLKVYTLANCDTCRRAVKWLRAKGVVFEELPIRESPPTPAELHAMLSAHHGERRKLFNTAGRDYHDQKIAAKLAAITDEEAIALLAANGNLVKRPFAIGAGVALVGFDEKEWRESFR